MTEAPKSDQAKDLATSYVSPQASQEDAPKPTDPQRTSQELHEKLRPVLEAVPESKRAEVERKVISVAMSVVEEYSGDVTHPKIAGAWENLCPGSAERLLTMAENQGRHRIWWERSAMIHGAAFQYIGLIFALLVSLGLVGGAVYCAIINQPWVSTAFLAASAAGMVTAFLNRKPNQQTLEQYPAPDPVPAAKSNRQAKQNIATTPTKKPPRRR